MSDYQHRFKAAELEMQDAGIWPSNAVPLYTRLLYKFGLKPVPPHYKPFWRGFLGQSVFFTLLIGLVSISSGSIPGGRSVFEFCVRTVLIGSVSGLILAGYYASSSKTNALSRWTDL